MGGSLVNIDIMLGISSIVGKGNACFRLRLGRRRKGKVFEENVFTLER